ncbi:GAG-pre-integrase domain-containing protein, partial [Aeromonas veronii]|uniref:GAG-pre-integrase domain-containing protein n=1 Tax=Aeromonas veronii TaxID=654 RepID=UPI00406CB6E3
MEFHSEKCLLIENGTNEVKLTGRRIVNLYVADWNSTSSNTCLIAQKSSDEAWLWHKRLSHLNFKNINILSQSKATIGLPVRSFVKDSICSACQKGKQPKTSCKKKISKPEPKSIRVLQLLHIDLFGPVDPTSVSGKKYT